MVQVPPPKLKARQAIRPTLDTLFYIDFEWWERSDRELGVYLRSHLCPEHYQVYENYTGDAEIDWVDPDTAQVTRVDGVQHILRTHCSQKPDYISPHTTLVDAVFRVFMANNNKPLTPVELGQRINRDPALILRTLSGQQIYKGLRPYLD